MKTPSESDRSSLPVFVDHVDKVVEFIDTCPQHPTIPETRAAAVAQGPLLTDVVDRIAEFIDVPPGQNVSPLEQQERRPILTDIVDRVVEFTDAASSQAIAGKSI